MDIPRQFQHLDFHVSPKENRASIEANGLRAKEVWDEYSGSNGKGVFISPEPDENYGDDVYGIDTVKGGHEVEEDMQGLGTVYIPNDVPTSDFKRVGHIYRSPNGHPEVHWHKEEECPNG